MNIFNNKRAFTLIELLVVILIIGILSYLAITAYKKAVEKSRAAEALQTTAALGRAATFFTTTNSDFPTKLSDLDVTNVGITLTADKFYTDTYIYNMVSYAGSPLKEVAAMRINPNRDNVIVNMWNTSAFGYSYVFGNTSTATQYKPIVPGKVYCAAHKTKATALQKEICANYGPKVASLSNSWEYYAR